MQPARQAQASRMEKRAMLVMFEILFVVVVALYGAFIWIRAMMRRPWERGRLISFGHFAAAALPAATVAYAGAWLAHDGPMSLAFEADVTAAAMFLCAPFNIGVQLVARTGTRVTIWWDLAVGVFVGTLVGMFWMVYL